MPGHADPIKAGSSLCMFPSTKLFRDSGSLGKLAVTASLPIIKSMASTSTSFTGLTNNGIVLTWGSALHPHLLGRHPTAETPAELPHPVSALEGIPIRKVAVGGWICAALSTEDDLYLWGGPPGNDITNQISCLPAWKDGEDVKLVDINGGTDVVDAAVGDGHVVILTASRELFVTGQGYEGQLGLGEGYNGHEQGWIKVDGWLGRQTLSVEASGWNSFLTVRKE